MVASRGFTLVELLVALMVMAVLSLMAWRGLAGMSRAREATQARADGLQALQSGLTQWGADLDAVADAAVFAAGANAQSLDWNGQSLRLVRHATALGSAAAADAPAQGGLRVVAWSLQTIQGQAQWCRWQSGVLLSRSDVQAAWNLAAQWSLNPNAALQAQAVAIAPVQQWQIFYYRSDAWSNPQSSNDVAAALPDGVRLQLTLPPQSPFAGVLTRDWIRPQVGGNKS